MRVQVALRSRPRTEMAPEPVADYVHRAMRVNGLHQEIEHIPALLWRQPSCVGIYAGFLENACGFFQGLVRSDICHNPKEHMATLKLSFGNWSASASPT